MVSARCGPWNLLLNHQGRRHANGNRERETEEEASMIDEESRDKSAWRLDKKRRPAFSGIIVDGGGPGWLDGDSVESAKWRPYLVAIHVCEDSENGSKFSKSFPVMEMNDSRGSNSRESFAKKLIKRLAKQRAMPTAVTLEFDPTGPLGNWVSLAKCYANQLPAASIVLAVHKGKTIFKRQSVDQFRGFQLDLRPEFYFSEVNTTSRDAKALKEDSEFLVETNSINGNMNSQNKKALLGSISVIRRQIPESNVGWPLRRRSSHGGQEVLRKGARNVSVVQWVMSLPNRSAVKLPKEQSDMAFERPEISLKNELEGIEGTSPLVIQILGDEAGDSHENPKDSEIGNEVKQNVKMALSVSFIVKELQQETESFQETESETSLSNQTTDTNLESQIGWVSNNSEEQVERVMFNHSKEMNIENNALGIVSNQLELPIKMNQSGSKWFTYAELEIATSNFSAENLIGEGGCSTVYRGCLSDGSFIVVKVLKSYKGARDDFLLEINTVSSINHKHITPLIGVCMENECLMSVYEYFPEGSLEERLHVHSGRGKFQWEMRFKVAVAVAEALNYLHNECSPPVIHRDVKSSNILLSDKLQPQLSDFGLAMWGPTDLSYVINTDVVGTFGYIAPEYLMHGRVSDKIDVYAFGIVLLELLSGRRPIDFSVKRQGSLVLWAKEVLNSGDPKELMDPSLDIDFNDVQVQRMVSAATLCIDPSPRLRPNVSKILKLLKGEAYIDDIVNFRGSEELHDIDNIFPKFVSKPSLSFALRDIDYDCTSSNNTHTTSNNTHTTSNTAAKKTRRLKLKDYLKEEQE
ncbi:3-phosphoinositide-dependent protein kinase B-like isoform X2 [Momordica charantia]|uniref:3-phosphoinositide-dependent protein kinase B-like isoform X2 n=1 Tax=Momordica charantia TaxID=3673 RepID=A0A6J1BTB7_MOMCH|nr:3-phosphoinositide-dependent protein kinase B-like isoform X2 [Momordica charantia]